MNFASQIHQLLIDNEKVIIPGFGAFIATKIPAEIIDEQILPPSVQVSFDKEVRNNDGLLVGNVAEIESISHFDALQLIEKERDALIEKIKEKTRVTFGELGSFIYYEEEILFEASKENDLYKGAFGLEAISLADFPKHIKSEPIEDPPAQEPFTEEIPLAIPDEPEPVYTVVDNEEETKKKRGWIWILLILIPLGVASIFILKKQNLNILSSEPEQDTTINITTVPAPAQDTIINDSVPAIKVDTIKPENEKPVNEKLVKTEESDSEIQAIQTDKPMYYLVGGSFKEKANAEKYIKQLENDGFEPFFLGKKGSFFVVGIGQYETMSEASQAKQSYLEKNPGSGVWIKKE